MAVGRLERRGEAGGIQKLEGTEIGVGGVVRACVSVAGVPAESVTTSADTLGWAKK